MRTLNGSLKKNTLPALEYEENSSCNLLQSIVFCSRASHIQANEKKSSKRFLYILQVNNITYFWNTFQQRDVYSIGFACSWYKG